MTFPSGFLLSYLGGTLAWLSGTKKTGKYFTSSFSATTAEHDVTLTHYDNFLPIMTITIVVVIECVFGMDLFYESIVVFLYRFLVRVKKCEKVVRKHTVTSNLWLRADFRDVIHFEAVETFLALERIFREC